MVRYRCFFIITFLCFPFFITAQVSFPVVDTGKIWSIVEGNYHDGLTTTAYKFENDTTLNGLLYYQVYECYLDSTLLHWNLTYGFFVREDSLGNVYNYDSSGDFLLYTFNLEPGDSIFTGYQIGGHDYYAFVDTVDSVLINGDLRKRIVFGGWLQETWLEGIGSIHHILYPFSQLYTNEWLNLLCVHEDGILIYQNEEWNDCYVYVVGIANINQINKNIKISPNPVTDQSKVEMPCLGIQQNRLQIINVEGEIVRTVYFTGPVCRISKEGLPAGIYFLSVVSERNIFSSKFLIQ